MFLLNPRFRALPYYASLEETPRGERRTSAAHAARGFQTLKAFS